MSRTKIAWSEYSWNPVVGCTKCSPGCRNCWAERMAGRLANMGQEKYKYVTTFNPCPRRAGSAQWLQKWNNHTRCDEKALDIPLHWKKPRRIFVNSMSDTFHKSVPFEFIDKVMDVIWNCNEHTFQVLTKRPERMLKYFNTHNLGLDTIPFPLDNLWLGATVEHPDYKNRIDILRSIPAAVRFLSIEPCLADMGELNLDGIHQVVGGGESGAGARPMHPDWARSIRDQCQAANPPVPFFFKHWGAWIDHSLTDIRPTEKNAKIVFPDGSTWPWSVLGGVKYKEASKAGGRTVIRVGKKRAGRLLDGKEYNGYPTKEKRK